MIRPLLLVVALAGCANSTQTTSGAAYLAARDGNGPLTIDADIARIAAVEPRLHFPARIGVAQVINGQLALPDAATADLFAGLAQRHERLGSFIPVSPLIAAMVNGEGGTGIETDYRSHSNTIVNEIRRASARQHLDYVLIYEVGARSTKADTVFALADVTLIGGAFLPTRSIKVAGIGQALFLDVRNGYPYGTAQATEDLSGLARSFGTHRRDAALQQKAIVKTTAALLPEVETMLTNLLALAKG